MSFRGLMSRHAALRARRQRISLDHIEDAYVSPDATRLSSHDEDREIRTLYVGKQVIEIVVDTIDGRVVTVWRKGQSS